MRSDNIKLVRKGAIVELKEDKPVIELHPKEVLDNIKALQDEIEKSNAAITKSEAAIPELKKGIEQNTAMLAKFNKFKEWATDWQKSKARTIIEDVKDKVLETVQREYKNDPTLTDEQNIGQKFRHYIGKLSTHPLIAEHISNEIMRDTFYINPNIANPFK